MSFGKNPKNFSKGKKGAKKKVGDRFLKKEWWNIKSPGMFQDRFFTKSPVNVTQGKKLSEDAMKGRVYEANLGDLNKGAQPNKRIKLIVEETENKIAYTNFYGLECTRDFLCSLIRKWHSLIDIFVDCKTSDGFLMRYFIVAFTAKAKKQMKATCFAQRSQIKQIRAIISKVMSKTSKTHTLKEMVSLLIGDELTKEMTDKCKKIFPLENVTIRKVKSIKRPRFDQQQLKDMQAETKAAGIKEKEEKKDDVTSKNLLEQ